ncbi:hypothetical protein FBQ82_16360 [Anaerolineae bacterium CFX7]|nr:hypothetical protein [Anaerolineae bacterium CFX7]
MILPKKRDPRFITLRRGGTLQDADHQLLALWAADCAEHVLHFFEEVRPPDYATKAVGLYSNKNSWTTAFTGNMNVWLGRAICGICGQFSSTLC